MIKRANTRLNLTLESRIGLKIVVIAALCIRPVDAKRISNQSIGINAALSVWSKKALLTIIIILTNPARIFISPVQHALAIGIPGVKIAARISAGEHSEKAHGIPAFTMRTSS